MTQPNILIMMTDQQRADSIAPWHSAPSPNLDQFCKEGVRFTNARCPSPHCCPSRATFFTGLMPSQHGVWNNICNENSLSDGLVPGTRCWSDDLADAGYQLAFVGKWHVSTKTRPSDHGFQELAEPVSTAKWRPAKQSWQNYKDRFSQEQDPAFPPGTIKRPGYGNYTHYGTNENPLGDQDRVNRGIEFIKEQGDSDQPWCCYIGTLGPHDPYTPPQRFLEMVPEEACELPASFRDDLKTRPGLYQRTRAIFSKLTELEHREALRHYWAFCAYQDYLFGQVLEALEHSGQRDNTVVLYCSDHGDYAAEHGLWCKGLPCFKGAYEVPFVIRWPDALKEPGREVSKPVALRDWANTVREIAGLSTGPGSGRSLLPFLMNEEPTDWRDAHYTQSNGNELYGVQRSVDDGKWKYVYNGFALDELYDLSNDPEECHNLADQEAYQEQVQKMCKKMWAFGYEHEDHCLSPYVMVALAPVGPGAIFEGQACS